MKPYHPHADTGFAPSFGNADPQGPKSVPGIEYPKRMQGEKVGGGVKRIPYTCLAIGDSHTVRAYIELAHATAVVDNKEVLSIKAPAPVRAALGERINAAFDAVNGIIEAQVVSDDGAGNFVVRALGANLPSAEIPTQFFRSSNLGALSPLYWVQSYVGRPFDELSVQALGGLKIEETLELLRNWGTSREKDGFAFYQCGTNNLPTGLQPEEIKALYTETLDLLEEMAHIVVIQPLTNLGYTGTLLNNIREANRWLEEQCAVRGLVWGDWNKAYVVRNGETLCLESPETGVMQDWARFNNVGDGHFNPTAAKAVADTVLVPALREYLPAPLVWTPGLHKLRNKMLLDNTPDPLFALGMGVPNRCPLYLENSSLSANSRVSLNGAVDAPHAHTAWQVAASALVGTNVTTSSIVQDFSYTPVNLQAFSGERICFAVDVTVPAGSRFSGFYVTVFGNNTTGFMGKIDGGVINALYNTACGIYGDEDVTFAIITNWFVLPKNWIDGTKLTLQLISRWNEQENRAHGKVATVRAANPRILLKKEWAGHQC
jgi:hypothetical protein